MNRKYTPEEKTALEEHTKRLYSDRSFAIKELCTIADKSGKMVKFDLWSHQKRLLKYVNMAINNPHKSILASPKQRQNGTSAVTTANNMVEARLYNNRNSLYLIKADEDTQPFFDDKVKQIDDNLPDEWKGKKDRDQSTSLKYEDTKSAIRIQTAGATEAVSSKKGRSTSLRYVHVTEAAYIPYLEAMNRGIRGALPANGTIVYESTCDGPRNYFYEICMGIYNDPDVVELEKNVWRAGHNWLIFTAFWEYLECRTKKPDGWKLRDEFELTKWNEILKDCGDEEAAVWYIQEYRSSQTREDHVDAKKYMNREHPVTLMDGFLDSERDYFDPGVLKGIKSYIDTQERKCYQFGLMRMPGSSEGETIQTVEPSRNNCVNVWALPELGWKNRYMLCPDPAKGLIKGDFDSFHVFDRVNREEVAFVHGKLGGEMLGHMAMLVGAWYDNAWISADVTGGHFEAARLVLMKNLYPNLHSRRDVDNIYIEHEFFGVVWGETNKYSALAILKYNWQHSNWRIWDPGMYSESKVFGYPDNGKTPCAAEGFHDDKIMDFALIALVESVLPPPVKTELAKPFKPVNEVQKIMHEAKTRGREVSAYSGMGNWD